MKKVLSSDLIFYFSSVFMPKMPKLSLKNEIIVGVGGNVGDSRRRFQILISHLKTNKKIKIKAIQCLGSKWFKVILYNDLQLCEVELSKNYEIRILILFHNVLGKKQK